MEPQIAVDTHIHLLPLRLANSIRAFFLKAGMVDPSADHPDLAYPVVPLELVQSLSQELELNREWLNTSEPAWAWTLPYAHKPGMSAQLNRDVLALTKEMNEAQTRLKVIPGLTVHAGDGEGPIGGKLKPEEVLEEALTGEGKVERVAKLHCSVGDYDVLDERLKNFFELAEALRLPVVVHAGHSVMGTTETHELSSIGSLCGRYPHLPVILAHAGHPATVEALDLTVEHPNLHLDTAPVVNHLSLPKVTRTSAHQILHLALECRLLFGSDSPNVALKRTETAHAVRQMIRACAAIAIGGLHIEDAGGEMERVALQAEKCVFGEAAKALLDDVRSFEHAKLELENKKLMIKDKL